MAVFIAPEQRLSPPPIPPVFSKAPTSPSHPQSPGAPHRGPPAEPPPRRERVSRRGRSTLRRNYAAALRKASVDGARPGAHGVKTRRGAERGAGASPRGPRPSPVPAPRAPRAPRRGLTPDPPQEAEGGRPSGRALPRAASWVCTRSPPEPSPVPSPPLRRRLPAPRSGSPEPVRAGEQQDVRGAAPRALRPSPRDRGIPFF
ncbi:translation initiation factor IF-2-like [Physeter macrocephalus]|uniref:Translation initiation factor IF-2-like n=1 Tax=Physeter macrocephalus TaxID=9755 RepID=A0A2Y9S4P9_PHYMC|nr:translation initiation factor IF-2-like [Physeter catodon]|eukprot:XP_023970854.1 uncharacterized protein LOC112061947 [Physeter catodon]